MVNSHTQAWIALDGPLTQSGIIGLRNMVDHLEAVLAADAKMADEKALEVREVKT